MRRVILGIVAVLVIIAVFAGLYWFISPDTAQERQGFALVLALSLGGIAAIVGLYFTRQTLLTTRELEAVRARDAALRACLEQLGRVLTDDKWCTGTQAGDTLRYLARAEALSVMGSLDGPRKRILVRFLYESRLLNVNNPMVDLSGADLREADLNRSNLPRSSLCGVRLRGANLSRATLSGSDLSGSDLRDSSNGKLVRTNLTRANLLRTNLSNTDLRGVDLRRAKNLTQEQIEQALGDERTQLPIGLRLPERWHRSVAEQLGEA